MKILKIFIFILLLILCHNKNIYANNSSDTTGFHEITIFIYPSAAPINWESPSTLYKSARKSISKIIFRRKLRFLGHMAMSINSDLLEEPLWIGIAPDNTKQMTEQVFIQKAGLGVLGIPFDALIEDKLVLEENIKYYLRHKRVITFVSYQINEQSAKQMLEFISEFQTKIDDNFTPCETYGGIFWPLYEGEGSGCSALCMAIMEPGGVLPPENEQWKIKINIPADLIGGKYYNRDKVPLRKIKKTKSWYNGEGIPNIDYSEFEIYEPALLMDWVLDNMDSESVFLRYYDDFKLIGLHFDNRDKYPEKALKPLEKRANPNLLIKGSL